MAPALGLQNAALLADLKSQFLSNPLQSRLINGWPAHLDARLTWEPAQYAREDQFIYHLSEVEKEEIEQALRIFNGLNCRTFLVLRIC